MPVLNLAINRKLTRAFIAVNPVTLTLTPRDRIKKPAGGWVYEARAPRAPQVLTLIEQTADPLPQVTVDGIDRQVDFVLLGEHDALFGIGDVFMHEQREWELVEVFYDNQYEQRAMVSGRG